MTTVIIGSGFSGVMSATHLVRLGFPGRIVLVEKGSAVGEGPAYSTHLEQHLLNVPAFGMSAYPDESSHFADWAAVRGYARNAFVPRMVYGEYLKEQFQQVADKVEVIFAEATAVNQAENGYRVDLSGGQKIEADYVVAALGNFKPQHLHLPAPTGFHASRFYQADPWSGQSAEAVAAATTILLIGTSLTAVDKVLELAGPERHIYALSRHGMAPQPHVADPKPFDASEAVTLDAAGGVRELLRQFRAEVKRRAGDWRTVVASLRSSCNAIWQRLPAVEKSRFLRHLRSRWDNHRHLVAESIHERLESLRASGQLTFLDGRLQEFGQSDDRAVVSYETAEGPQELEVDLIVNCTGPSGNIQRVDSPMLQGMIRQGLVRPNSTRLGLEPDEQYQAIASNGEPSENLFVIGPLLKGFLFESIAVPELRGQAQAVARTIAESARASA
jgi:uncharacterized NAD(P)/FAD-binding protein YdhS